MSFSILRLLKLEKDQNIDSEFDRESHSAVRRIVRKQSRESNGFAGESVIKARAFAVNKLTLEHALSALVGRVHVFKKIGHESRSRVLLLTTAIVTGNLKQLESMIKSYAAKPELLSIDLPVLAYVFKPCDLVFLETQVYSCEIENKLGKHYNSAANLLIELPSSQKVLCLSTHPGVKSVVFDTLKISGRSVLSPNSNCDAAELLEDIAATACINHEQAVVPADAPKWTLVATL